MSTNNKISDNYIDRFTFIETLSREFIAATGHGIYVHLDPIDIEQLYASFQGMDLPILQFARQCIRKLRS